MRTVVGAVVLGLSLAGCGSDAALQAHGPGGIFMSMTTKVGERVAWTDLAMLRASEPVRLVSARFSAVPDGVEPLGASMVEPTPRLGEAVVSQDMGARDPRPVKGFRVEPTGEKGYVPALYLGIVGAKPGRYVIRGIDVVYEQGDARHTLHVDNGLVLCVVRRYGRGPQCDFESPSGAPPP